jgi:Tfp pilus assembly protein PilN
MAKQVLSINLAKKQGNTSLDTILHWAITGGRFIVILTETVALGAFLYRFALDRQIVDWHDKIKSKTAIVNAFKTQEDTYRGLQDRLQQAKQLDQAAPAMPTLFTTLVDAARGKVTYNTLMLSQQTLRLEIAATSVASLDAFVNILRANKNLHDVSIDKIENRTSEASIIVAISANVDGLPKLPVVTGAPAQGQTGQ